MKFDYIIVGAGSAGCALAARIADANPNHTVALLEAGPDDNTFLVHIPILAAATFSIPNSRNWYYHTVPQPGLKGRRGFQPRGRGLGGSSSINAMIYIRGHHEDYNDWEKLGCPGWGWNDVFPYFKRAENNERGADAWHSTGGPLNVTDFPDPNPFTKVFIEAAKQAGYPYNPDFNSAVQEGVGYFQITEKKGARCNSARAYIHSKTRKNLEVIINAQALRILFDNKRASGVEIERAGKIENIYANHEVLLSAGAFGSPHLLLRSGIGPADHLSQFNIPVLHHAPEVGANLQDHITHALLTKIKSPDLFGYTPRTFFKFLRGFYQFKRYQRGVYTSTQCEAGGFLKTDPTLDRPDIQLHFENAVNDNHMHTFHMGTGVSLDISVLHPKSRGNVLLASNNPKDAPLINPNFFAAEEDLEVMVKGVKMARKIMTAPAMAIYNGKEIYSANVANDDEWREIIRQHADTLYHPVGTCRMGSDATAVVDTDLRVNGVEGLRVVDASIMPKIIGGNTNAPSIMIGEKGADLVIGKN